MSETIREWIQKKKVIAICRGIYGNELMSLADALQRGGLSLAEVTFDQSDPDAMYKTAAAITALRTANPEMAIGAGTVLTEAQLDVAIHAGAQFMIAPNVNVALIHAAKSAGLVCIPGAATPTEIVAAYEAGADFVKLFPCACLGSAYIKAIRSPLSQIGLIATGGIDANNLGTYLALGMVGAGIGGKLCDRNLVATGRFDLLEQTARACAQVAAAY